jgi:hypothetical protein
MAPRLSRKTNETQAPPNETPIYREFQTRIREEDLTEEQLSVREKELKILSEKVSALYYKDARLKASNKQCAIYEEFGLCLTSLMEISRSMLRVKITDRLEALSAEEKEKELKSWTDARKEDALIMMAIFHGDKAVGIKEWEGISRGSYRDPRYEHYDPHLSKEETLRLIAKKRAALVRFTEIICDGLNAWDLDESSEFWPANANAGMAHGYVNPGAAPVVSGSIEQKKQDTAIRDWSAYKRLIVSKLVSLGDDDDYLSVARRIPARHTDLPEGFLKPSCNDGSLRSLEQLLLKDDLLKTRFMKSVSGVRCALKELGG